VEKGLAKCTKCLAAAGLQVQELGFTFGWICQDLTWGIRNCLYSGYS